MQILINIDKIDDTPIYLQIIEQITVMVKNSVLKVGDKLPPERELANELGVARGTISKAYRELERNKVIEVIQGSGTYISRIQDILDAGRKEKAISIIDELLSKLESMNFTQREISILINVLVNDRESKFKKIQIAAVDCNPEALCIFEKQLAYISHVKISKLLLDDIYKSKSNDAVFMNYDIIFTTSTHYNELATLIPAFRDRLIQMVVSPSHQTIIDIAKIHTAPSIGIICSSLKFLNIIKNSLKSTNNALKDAAHIFDNEKADIMSFIKSKDTLIIPPYTEFETRYQSLLDEFCESGNKIIRFDYQIERGSLIYIEEQISNILKKQL